MQTKDISKPTSRVWELIHFNIKIDGDDWNQIKPPEKFDKDRIDQRLNDPWTYVVNRKIWEAQNLSCAFTFKKQKFYKSAGFPYFEIFGHCNDKSCYQDIHGVCSQPDDDGVTIKITCYNTHAVYFIHKN